MNITEAIHHALNGRAILFTGAGFSFGASNHQGKKIPSGDALATVLLTEVAYSNRTGSLDKASAAYLRRRSRPELVDLLLDCFTLGDVTESHREIAKVPWKRTYTTNYDLVFEQARKEEGIVCNSIDGIDEPRNHISKKNLIIHINGAINRLSEDRLDSSFKLISESYSADSFEDSGWAFHFRNDVRTAAAIIFVGYSMYDLDIRRILFSENISDRSIFIVAPLNDDNELAAEDLVDLGLVAPIGIDAFSDLIAIEQKVYLPVEDELLLDAWCELVQINGSLEHPGDEEIIEFLTEGMVSDSLAVEAIGPNKSNYLLDHEVTNKIKKEIEFRGTPVLLKGELGTGKTFVLNEISQHLLVLGWRIFKLDIKSDNELGELEEICAQPGKKLLIVENYQSHLDLLKWFCEAKPLNAAIALTARSTIHDLFSTDLALIFQAGIMEFDISVLRPREVQNVVQLFDRYGLWGDRLGWPAKKKENFIKHDCSNSLPSVLLDILKSKHIAEKYKILLDGLPNQADVESVLICAFSLEVIGLAPRISHIQELLSNKVNWSKVRSQPELRSIIDIDSNFLAAKSSVLALHLLHSTFSPKRILITLIQMSQSASNLIKEPEYKHILNLLMRYKNVSSILPDENKLSVIINFYENIKNLPSAVKNPQFWLQYAIACLALGKLGRAERYFDDAYDLVYPGYNTFKLDNSYARLLLEKSALCSSTDDTIFLVDEAKEIILSQMRVEKTYNPYRVALGFFKVYERFAQEWKHNQQLYFYSIFSEIQKSSLQAIAQNRNHHYIRECLSQSSRFVSVP